MHTLFFPTRTQHVPRANDGGAPPHHLPQPRLSKKEKTATREGLLTSKRTHRCRIGIDPLATRPSSFSGIFVPTGTVPPRHRGVITVTRRVLGRIPPCTAGRGAVPARGPKAALWRAVLEALARVHAMASGGGSTGLGPYGARGWAGARANHIRLVPARPSRARC
jgi:hypothetical protein